MTTIKPYKFQREVLNEMNWFDGGVLLSLPCGTGKTLVTIWYFQRHPELLPAIVVCPASVKLVWVQEVKKVEASLRTFVCQGLHPPELSSLESIPDLIIINYDVLKAWTDWLECIDYKCVVLDESQNLNNYNTIRSKSARKICKKAKKILALSGTPFLNKSIELFNVLNLLRPDIWNSRLKFAEEFCAPKLTPRGWDFSESKNLKKLHRDLKEHCMVRRIKEEVLPDLPDKFRSVVPVPLSDPQEYQSAEDDFMEWLRQQDPTKVGTILKTEGKVKVGYLLRLAAKLKLPACIQWINDRVEDTKEKTLVFGHHQAVLEALQKDCVFPSVLVNGSVPEAQRKRLVERFQRDPEVLVLFGQHQAAGVGLNLQVATQVVFVELSWRPGDLIQCEDRAYRIGSKNSIFVNYLISSGTIEERQLKVIQRKQANIDEALDGNSDAGSSSVFNDIMNEYASLVFDNVIK